MKISIVIPTRNRLEYLKSAIASVLNQKYENWEIVISDNDSNDNTEDYVLELKEPRIVYSKTEKFISVTDNWNRALNLSTGDYVILIGDDDCIMKDSLELLSSLIKSYDEPDFVFSNGLHYVYPGVMPGFPKGHLTTIGNWNLWGNTPSLIPTEKLKELAEESLNFRLYFSYNLQLLTIKRSFIESLKINKLFFHSPYPDFYAMTILFYKAKNALACPYPTSITGICSKSFGGHYFNNNENKGMETLNVGAETQSYKHLDKFILPGSKLNTCWLYALHTALQNLGLSNVKCVNYKRYRQLQVVEFLKNSNFSNSKAIDLVKFSKLLYPKEVFTELPKLCFAWLLKRTFGLRYSNAFIEKLRKNLNQHPGHNSYRFKKKYYSIIDVATDINPQECAKQFINN